MALSLNLSYSDFKWDLMPKEERDKISLEQLKKTVLFAKKNVPFYIDFYSRITEIQIRNISNFDDFLKLIPELNKSHLSNNLPEDFLPRKGSISLERDEFLGEYRNFGTGGTTGLPVTIYYSIQDWRAMVLNANRMIKFDFKDSKKDFFKGKTIMGLYHGDHITNNIYRSMFSDLGMNIISRASTKMDLNHNYDLFLKSKPNGILAPPEEVVKSQTKGITLDKFIHLDSREKSFKYKLDNKKNSNFQMVFWSSMPLSKDLHFYLKDHLSIPYIKGHFGSTELAPTGSTCEHNPFSFHLCYGPSLVLLKDIDSGDSIEDSSKEGYLLVSKIGATDRNGNNLVPSGSYIINFRTGDYGTLENVNEVCKCGRNTPRINVYRKEEIKLKKEFGCQVD